MFLSNIHLAYLKLFPHLTAQRLICLLLAVESGLSVFILVLVCFESHYLLDSSRLYDVFLTQIP